MYLSHWHKHYKVFIFNVNKENKTKPICTCHGTKYFLMEFKGIKGWGIKGGKIQREFLLSFGMYNMAEGKEIKNTYFPNSYLFDLKLRYINWFKELIHWKRPWCRERLRAGGEGYDRGWDGWMASPTQCTWLWVDSGSWWWTGRPGVLWFMGSQRVGHDWGTELNWTKFQK